MEGHCRKECESVNDDRGQLTMAMTGLCDTFSLLRETSMEGKERWGIDTRRISVPLLLSRVHVREVCAKCVCYCLCVRMCV